MTTGPRRCTVYDNDYAFGVLFTGLGVFAAYILFFRPDIHKEVNALIWIFRVIFPFGFGLAGLAMLGRSVRTVFDATQGTFVHTRTSLFRWVTRKGDARRGDADRAGRTARGWGRRGWRPSRDRMQWRLTLSMDLGGELVPLRKWSRTIEGNRPQNEAVVKAKEEAERVARLIGRPLALAWEKTAPP